MTANHDTSRISPTAHYTGYVWYRNGMSFDAFATELGLRLYRLLRPFNAVYRRVARRPHLEMTLLARHRIIDALLEQAIAEGKVGQVIEIAGGLSPRGATFAARHPGLTYVEGDLPDMVAHKRSLLARAGLRFDNHRVVELNALADEGPVCLDAVAGELLAPGVGTAIITEGLTGYFPAEVLAPMWYRFSAALGRFPHGAFFSDIQLGGEAGDVGVRTFKRMLAWFAKGDVYLHWQEPHECEEVLLDAGFATAALRSPGEFADAGVPAPDERHLVRVIDARV